jgi:hypothetical protein
MHIRPIDQELDHHRVVTIVEEDTDVRIGLGEHAFLVSTLFYVLRLFCANARRSFPRGGEHAVWPCRSAVLWDDSTNSSPWRSRSRVWQTALDGFHVKSSGSTMIPSGYTKMMHPPRRYSAPPTNTNAVIGEYSPTDGRSVSLASSGIPASSSHHRRQNRHDSKTMIEFGSHSLPSHYLTSHDRDGFECPLVSVPKHCSAPYSKHGFGHARYHLFSQFSPH